MASSVATPLERALGTIAGVNEITSNSSQGSTRIYVQFDLGKDINAAAREVQAAINAVAVAAAERAAGHAELPQDQPVAGADHDPGADLEDEDRRARSTTSPRPCWRRRWRRSPASATSPSAADRCRPCASNCSRTRSRITASRSTTCAGRSSRRQPAAAEGRGRGRPALLADPGQRPADQGRRLPAADRPLPERRAGAPVGRGPRHRRRRGPLQYRLLQQRARRCCSSSAGSPTPTSSRRWTRSHEQLPALRAFLPRRRAQHRQRPLAQHPRHAARSGAHAAHRGLARDPRRAAVPRQRPRGR